MKLSYGFQQIAELGLGSVATIGNFDGVHRGHQALLAMLRSQASRMQLPMVVMLFEPQPGEYFYGKEAPARLSSLREKVDMLRQCGADYVFCLKFNQDLASMSAIEFAERFIFTLIQAKYLLIGEDFRFGHDRIGDVSLLNELGSQQGCFVQKFSDFFIDTQRVSSTKIRHALKEGKLDYAAKLLGRPYSMCGRIVRGAGRGRQWGIPTANVNMHHKVLPLTGVFCVRVKRQGKPLLTGVANIGCRPTIDGTKNILEIHLFDTNESLYGEIVQVYFLHKLRDEVKFSSVDDLIAQIHNDIAAAKAYYERGCEIACGLD
jgi:riboflavin kinase/FMN adenylyltransferase